MPFSSLLNLGHMTKIFSYEGRKISQRFLNFSRDVYMFLPRKHSTIIWGTKYFSRLNSSILLIIFIYISQDELLISLCGKNLDKKDFFGKSDPYLVFEKCNEDNS